MDALFEWVKNIVFYLIFLTILMGLLPSGTYEKYIRLFAGMILILLAVKPFMSSMRMEEKMAGYFEEFSFRSEAGDLKKELYGMEKKRLEQLIAQYEEAVSVDVKQMAEEAGLTVTGAEATIEGNDALEEFGRVKRIRIYAVGRLADYREAAADLRRKASQYYQLEENHVEIQFKNEQR